MTETIKVGFKRLNDNAIIPTKAYPTDSGFDLYASKDVIIRPGETTVVPTGIAVELPPGYEATVRPRSGITAKTKLRVQLGTIDNEYRGEIGVIVDNISEETFNLGNSSVNYLAKLIDGKRGRADVINGGIPCDYNTYLIRKGDRIAQLVIQPIPNVEAYEVEGELKTTERGESGFGSTGVNNVCNHGPEPKYCPYCTEYDDNLPGWRPKREDY